MPARTQTPLRLFCQPFEDLLTSEPRKAKQKAVIARASWCRSGLGWAAILLPDETASLLPRDQGADRGRDSWKTAQLRQDPILDAGRHAMREALAASRGLGGARKRLSEDEIADAQRNGAAAARRRGDAEDPGARCPSPCRT